MRGVRDEIAALASGLPPAALERGLGSAIRLLVARSSLPISVDMVDVPADEPARSALYFACAEAIANAAKHATPTSIGVRSWAEDGWIVLEVRDDGVGGADPGHGTGLDGLRYRLEALGGTLVVESPPAGGTLVRAAVPTRKGPAGDPAESPARSRLVEAPAGYLAGGTS